MNLIERQQKFEKITLYPVITPEFCLGRPVLEVLQAVLEGGAKVVQLRDKQDPGRYARQFRRLTSSFDALLIINDNLEIALEVGADGVHLGQNDLPLTKARKFAPQLLIGASTHNSEEALKAQAEGASYINIGPLYETLTKENNYKLLSPQILPQIIPHLKIPFTVMGGINNNNLAEVLSCGARRIAMVTAITQAEDIKETVKNFIARIISFS